MPQPLHVHADRAHTGVVHADLPRSVMAQSALVRIAYALAMLVGLWLAVWWAANLP